VGKKPKKWWKVRRADSFLQNRQQTISPDVGQSASVTKVFGDDVQLMKKQKAIPFTNRIDNMQKREVLMGHDSECSRLSCSAAVSS